MDTQSATHDAPPEIPTAASEPGPSLGAELRESLLLLGCAVALTVGITTAAQAALTVLA